MATRKPILVLPAAMTAFIGVAAICALIELRLRPATTYQRRSATTEDMLYEAMQHVHQVMSWRREVQGRYPDIAEGGLEMRNLERLAVLPRYKTIVSISANEYEIVLLPASGNGEFGTPPRVAYKVTPDGIFCVDMWAVDTAERPRSWRRVAK
jgi:hypothetical protein